MVLNTLQDALVLEMQDLLSAEQQLLFALPTMAARATNPELKSAFELHLTQTQTQVTRLQQAFTLLGQEAESHPCQAMKGLLAEGREIMGEQAVPQVADALLIAAAQKVEHYEIATYGTVCTWAKQIGRDDVKELLGQSLNEEEQTDKILSSLAESLNQAAV